MMDEWHEFYLLSTLAWGNALGTQIAAKTQR